jgi:hypothetical protein
VVIPFVQESIRNSADKMLLTAPDSLVVSLAKHDTDKWTGEEAPSTSKKGRALGFGIPQALLLQFSLSFTLFLIFSSGAAFNSGLLSTMELGISSVYLCRRAHSATFY